MLSKWPWEIKGGGSVLSAGGFVGHFIQQRDQRLDLVAPDALLKIFVDLDALWADFLKKFDTRIIDRDEHTTTITCVSGCSDQIAIFKRLDHPRKARSEERRALGQLRCIDLPSFAKEAQNAPLLFRYIVLGQHRSEMAHYSFPRFQERDWKSLASAAQQSWVVFILIHDTCVEAIAVTRQHAF